MDTPPSLSKQVLLREVAKRHHLGLDENDPILVTITLNELLLDHTLAQLQTMLTNTQEEISATSKDHMTAAKETAARVINDSADFIDRRVKEAVTQAETQLEETIRQYLAQAQQNLKDTRWAVTAAITGGALMLGMGIGAFLARHL